VGDLRPEFIFHFDDDYQSGCIDVEYELVHNGETSNQFYVGGAGAKLIADENQFNLRGQVVTVSGSRSATNEVVFLETCAGGSHPCAVDFAEVGTLQVCVSNSDDYRLPSIGLHSEDASHYDTFMGLVRMRYYLEGGGEPTPTPEPTAQPDDGFCHVVEPDGGLGVELPQFGIGNSYCYGIDAIDTNIPLVGDIQTPEIRVCFDEYQFGVLDILGVEVDLDSISFMMAGVVILRLLLRS
jgi:hypothetical protein